MEFENQIQKLADRVEKNKDSVNTEEAKNIFYITIIKYIGL